MNQLLFQLGHCPELSFAEIAAVNQRLGGPLRDLRFHKTLALAESGDGFDLPAFGSELGGTIRVCEALHADPGATVDEESLHQILQAHAAPHCARLSQETGSAGKRIIGLSWLGARPGGLSAKRLCQLFLTAGARVKDDWKDEGISSRFVLPRDNDVCLSGAQVEKNRLLERGGEFVFWLENGRLHLGATRWLQPFEAFSKRDYGRPDRDARSGMLPPKLARMMIQLARRDSTRSMLDPFCGSGSVLMEAALMGLSSTGFDLSEKAVADTLSNWEWLRKKTSVISGTLRAMKGDAQQLRALCEPLYFDGCATEPFLGPPQSKPMKKTQADMLSKKLHALYVRALGEIRTVVKPGSRVVFIVPQFNVQGSEAAQAIPILSDIKFLGYQILDPMDGFSESLRRATLVYSRPNQIVRREIFVLQA